MESCSKYIKGDNGIFITNIAKYGSLAKVLSLPIYRMNGVDPIQVGDKIVEINGSSLTNLNHSDALGLFLTSGPVVNIKYVPGEYDRLIRLNGKQLEVLRL